jgi:hypothetical protein
MREVERLNQQFCWEKYEAFKQQACMGWLSQQLEIVDQRKGEVEPKILGMG